MVLHRFFIEPAIISGDKITITDRGLIHQMKDVLRFGYGDKIIFLDNSGFEFLSQIENISKNSVVCNILERRKNLNEPEVKIRLYQSVIKKDSMELVVQKGVEVGIFDFMPIIATRSEKKDLNLDRLNKIIREAAEQSGRGILPKLHPPIPFEEAIHSLKKGTIIFFDKDADNLSYFFESLHGQKDLNVFIGPEGGWSPEEMEIARETGATIASLGLLTLKSETVGVIAAGVIFASM